MFVLGFFFLERNLFFDLTRFLLLLLLNYLSNIVENRVEKDVESASARRDKRTPPPVIVFSAQLKVRHDHRDLGTRNNDNEEHEEQKAKQIIILVLPNGLNKSKIKIFFSNNKKKKII